MKNIINCPNCGKLIKDPFEFIERDSESKQLVVRCDKCDWGCSKEMWDYNISLIKRILAVLKSHKFKDIKEEQLIIHKIGVIGA